MEKVKLNQNQADAFESEVLTSDVESVARCHMRGWEYRCNRCLNELSLEQIMRAKYVGYEICPDEEIAEEKERRWWKKHGRQPWELRFDDVIIHKEKHEIIRAIDVQSKGEVIVFINGGYRETLNITYVKQLYSVVCFVDDRKDVKERIKTYKNQAKNLSAKYRILSSYSRNARQSIV